MLPATPNAVHRALEQHSAQLAAGDTKAAAAILSAAQRMAPSSPAAESKCHSAPARLMYLLRAIGGSGQLVTLSLVRGRPSGRPAAASGARASHLQIADVSACDHLGPELAGRQLDACLQSNQLVCAAHAARALLRHAPADHPELCTFLGSARAFGASAAALRWCPPG